MKTMPIRALAALVILAAACDAAPTAPAGPAAPADVPTAQAVAGAGAAEHFLDEDVFYLDDSYIPFSCDADGNPLDDGAGELVRLHGFIYSRFFAVLTPSGNSSVMYNTMPVGMGGVGVDSGEEFRVREAEHGTSSLTANGAVNPWRFSLTMVGRETGRRMTVTYSAFIRVTGDRVIVERQGERVECRAARKS